MNYKIYILGIVGLLISVSCSESFLETRPSEFLSAEEIQESAELNPEVGFGNVRGMYSTMFATESGGTTGHDDFGQKGYDIYTDMLVGDMVLDGTTYGWYSDIVQYQVTRNFSSTRNYMPWRFYYRIILGANGIISDMLELDPELEDADNAAIAGQAYAMRAYCYYNLANLFGEGSYQDYASQNILPIYTDQDQEAPAFSSGEEVFKLIIDDLDKAIDLLEGFSRSDYNEIDQYVANGILAYAYATMNNYVKVEEITTDLITNSPYSLLSADQLVGGLDGDFFNGGFNDVNTYNNSWMWGQDVTLDNELDLVSWWGQVDLFTYSYAWAGDPKTISYDLYESIPNGDIRKQQFEEIDDEQFAPMNKFYAPDRVIGGQRIVETDYVYMRIEEMYLLNAEAAAKNSHYDVARGDLEELLKIRMPDNYQTYLGGISDGDLLDEIYKQLRIELWGEGKSYFAFKRLHKSQALPSNHTFFPGETISYDESRMTFEIPEEERLNNPNF